MYNKSRKLILIPKIISEHDIERLQNIEDYHEANQAEGVRSTANNLIPNVLIKINI